MQTNKQTKKNSNELSERMLDRKKTLDRKNIRKNKNFVIELDLNNQGE